MRSPATERTVPGIITDLLTQFTQLLRTEGELARAELSGKVNQVGVGLVLVVGGAVLLIPALVVLLGAAVAALERAGYAPQWSALIVGGAALAVGLVLLMIGLNRLKADNLMPRKTIRQLREDKFVATQQMGSDHGNQRAA
jgi:membrane protein DedA with SNARE-associated domain